MDAHDESEVRDFHHPYEPYLVQQQFMNAVYDCLEHGKVGIFESPTGTGKSLSLICGSLTWLRDHKRRVFQDGLASDAAYADEPTWMLEHARKQKLQAALHRRHAFESRLAKIKTKEKRLKERTLDREPYAKRQKIVVSGSDAEGADEARFVLDDYDSGDDARQKARIFNDDGLSDDTRALMEKLGQTVKTHNEDDEATDETKIFFCSRTHSQLTQFSGELRRVQMPPALDLPDIAGSTDQDPHVEEVKHLTLGSRKNLCINPQVLKLGSAIAINERCLEIQQPGTSADCRCSFIPNKEKEALVNEFRDHAMARIRDIEDLGSLGKSLSICPYYASRPATKHSEIVTLPYPLLLQKTARQALDLSLKDHIVIIDEAHNLMDAIAGIYSVSVTHDQVRQARMQLTVYLQKFRNKLKGKNRVYVAQTLRILDSISAYLESKNTDAKAQDGAVDVGSLMSGKGADQINIYKLNTYLQESRLARKVDGYTNYAAQSRREGAPAKVKFHTTPALTHVQAFLLSLMNPSAEGRFFYSREEDSNIKLKYMLLDPTFHFKDVVEDARAVILAGGTMSPMSDYEQYLLSYVASSKIMTLSCDHVIPPSNLLAVPVVGALDGRDFDFTFERRNSEQMMIDLGHAIQRVARHTPDGVVVFFPSYSYLDICVTAWKRLRIAPSQTSESIWESLMSIKPIFLEQRSQSYPTNEHPTTKEEATSSVLDSYSSTIASGNGRGALLFAVIGGTLSEGINFSDALGRGVLVVGLPFPNPHTAEWKEKMQYISAKAAGSGQDGKRAAREFYENACMRAVNQCIGRAIRHRGDYAAILMLDKRYGGQQIQAKLPAWIRNSLTNGTGVRQVEQHLAAFFAEKHS